jgi:hypothetical protein
MFRMSIRRAQSRELLLPVLLLCAASQGLAPGAVPPKSATPILIELFTSEGCSSCPPADAWLKQIDQTQPIPGAEAIVLSEPVDYWNHDGWKDPFSSPFFTNRQDAYVHALGGSSPYTPEMIVNGVTELHLEDRAQVAQAFQRAAKAQQIAVSIHSVSVEGDAQPVLRAHIEADGASARHSADVYAVVALDHAESQVLRGENGGRRLTHAAVALDFVRVGELEKGKPFSRDFQTRLKPGLDAKSLRLIVFVQETGPGNVVGAALREIGASTGSAASLPSHTLPMN